MYDTFCLKEANKRKISRNNNVSNEKPKPSKKLAKQRWFFDTCNFTNSLAKKVRGKLVGFQSMVYLKYIDWNPMLPIPINDILKIH